MNKICVYGLEICRFAFFTNVTFAVLEEGEWAYCQILATLKCSDLMPPLAKMVVFDSSLPVRGFAIPIPINA